MSGHRIAAITKNPGAMSGWFDELARTTNPFEVKSFWWDRVATDTTERGLPEGRPATIASR